MMEDYGVIYVFEDCSLDTRRYELQRSGERVPLRPKVFQVLTYLINQHDRVVPRDELLEHVWPEQCVGDETLTSCIKAARRAVGDSGQAQRIIQTVHGRGYRFVAAFEVCTTTSFPSASMASTPVRCDETSLPCSYGGDRQINPCSFPAKAQTLRAPEIESRKSAERFLRRPSQYVEPLTSYLQETIMGQPRVVIIQGEAGFGKTRLLKEFQAVARQREVVVCYGRCSETLALSYFPFVESLLAYLEQALDDGISPPEADVEAIRWLRHPEQEKSLVASGFPSDPVDREKLRLFLAVSRTTLALVQRRPICFLLDDLHWADPSSLELFEHLVFTVADAVAQGPIPLLIMATYRPPEPSSRLASFMPRLQRETICQTFDLADFDTTTMATHIEGMSLGCSSPQLVALMQETTQSNRLCSH